MSLTRFWLGFLSREFGNHLHPSSKEVPSTGTSPAGSGDRAWSPGPSPGSLPWWVTEAWGQMGFASRDTPKPPTPAAAGVQEGSGSGPFSAGP